MHHSEMIEVIVNEDTKFTLCLYKNENLRFIKFYDPIGRLLFATSKRLNQVNIPAGPVVVNVLTTLNNIHTLRIDR
ncbi:MAG: hypothetical protein JJU28_24835 [Cyclobacteriaceae bacterium]|nr:hypothetical protein [Cyclobacteriaceae bacterium]